MFYKRRVPFRRNSIESAKFNLSELNPSRLGVLRVPDNEHDRRTMTTDAENSSKKLDSIEEHPG